MDYDVIIIGAGLSGLAAGVRLTHYGRKVRIFERHCFPGGLNSWYYRKGEVIDVGLHALTNYVAAGQRGAPLNKMLRQLRLRREDLDLRPQTYS
ncbi:MAG: NAD(P)-binding protein, partial [Lentisphaeria bacterium]|nr:NAD(P)-binding protein [Lentisphaeria bacterium]